MFSFRFASQIQLRYGCAQLMVLLQRNWMDNLWTASRNSFRICILRLHLFLLVMARAILVNCNISACSLNFVDTDPIRTFPWCKFSCFFFHSANWFFSIEFNILYPLLYTSIRLIFNSFFSSLFHFMRSVGAANRRNIILWCYFTIARVEYIRSHWEKCTDNVQVNTVDQQWQCVMCGQRKQLECSVLWQSSVCTFHKPRKHFSLFTPTPE